MTNFGLRALSIGFLLCAVGCASAPVEKYDYTTEGSNEVRAYSAYLIDDDCTPKTFDIKMTEKPSNGIITIKQAPGKIGDSAELETNPNCVGEPVNAQEVYYSAKEGFTGTDEFTIEISSEDIAVAGRTKIVVNVK